MAIYRGTGGSVEGISEADILVVTVAQGGTGAQTAAAARTNLGLGTAATTAATDYATAAQGAKADTAIQAADLSTVATTGAYSDLTGKPTLGTAAATAATDYATAAQGAKADTALQPSTIGVSVQAYNANTVVDSSYVHTDNNYTTTEKTKLSGIAEGAEVNVNADWNASSGDAQILNKPSLATVATSGSYTDLSNKPSLSTVATSGSYTDLSNTPTVPTNLDSLTDVVISSASTDQILKFNGTNWVNSTLSGSGTVTSVAMSVPTGLAVSGSPITSSGTLALTYDTGYAIPTTSKQTEWDTAYTDRNKWDGGSTGLNAATGRTSLGLGSDATGSNLSSLTNTTTARTNLGLAAIAASGSASDLSTGTVGTARLGSGTASSSTYLRGDQTWATISGGGATGITAQVFTSNGTFTIPSGVTAVKVTVVGGGGGGGLKQAYGSSGTGGGGGAGGVAIKYLTGLTSGGTLAVTRGAGGASASAGGTSSVASGTQTISTISATGGSGGGQIGTGGGGTGGAGGTGSGGDLNSSGGAGQFGTNTNSITGGKGGDSIFGGGGVARSAYSAGDGYAASGYGAGGSGAASNSSCLAPAYAGGAGSNGVVIFEW